MTSPHIPLSAKPTPELRFVIRYDGDRAVRVLQQVFEVTDSPYPGPRNRWLEWRDVPLAEEE